MKICKCGSLHVDLDSIIAISSLVTWENYDRACVQINGINMLFFIPSQDSSCGSELRQYRDKEFELVMKRNKEPVDILQMNMVKNEANRLERIAVREAQNTLTEFIKVFSEYKASK